MSSDASEQVYDFVYRAMLAEEALDVAGRIRRNELDSTEVADALSFELFDEDLLEQARLMSAVYTAIAAFEMSVRRFVKKVLMDTHGEDWWDKGVSEKIRKFVDSRRTDEEKVKWHGVRGDDLLTYTEQNWAICRRSCSRTGSTSMPTFHELTGRRRCSRHWSARAM